jgi:septal ring factor EnvC (AmiA/AmiB activator)
MTKSGAITLFCLFLMWLVSLPSFAAQASQKDLDTLNRNINELQQQLSSIKGKRSELRKTLRNSEVSIGSLQSSIRDLQGQLNSHKNELKTLQARRGKLLQAKQDQQQLISRQVLAAYQMGRQKKLKVLLNQQEPEKLSRALTYYDYFNRMRNEQIESYIATLEELDEIEPAIAAKTIALQETHDGFVAQRQQLTIQQSQREKTLLRLEATIRDKDQELKRKQKDSKKLQALMEAVEETIAILDIPSDYRPFKALKGKMSWPIKGKLLNRFGSSRGADLRWQGVMISAKEGTAIKAIHHGRVVFSDWFRGKGLLMIIDHGDGFMSLYAHNQSLLRETGDWVHAGETIATLGNSGGLQQAALYFEIRHQGNPTDPRQWCRG